jgi:ATP-dependent Clp protease adaptor protein ClpS
VADTIEQTGVEIDERTEFDDLTLLQTPWITIVWNDPVNLMSYVEWVFRSYFGFDRPEAHRRMMQVHENGRAVVANGTREEMERHVNAMHGYGLWATLQKEDEA